MDLVIITIFEALIIVLLFGWRISQWHGWYKYALANNKPNSCPAIFMLDFYDGPELNARLQKTKHLYFQLLEYNQEVKVMLTVGKLNGEIDLRSVQNKRRLCENGLPEDAVLSYGSPGAADTFEEVYLMCQCAREQHMDRHVYVIANLLQAIQVFMICIRNGIFPNIELVPLHNYPGWAAGKLAQIILTFFSPQGHNPISFLQRKMRWWVTSKI